MTFVVSWWDQLTAQVCKVCQVKFTTFKRRHHCRQCGACVCSLCSAFEWVLPHISASKPSRICRTCYFECVQAKKASGSSVTGTTGESLLSSAVSIAGGAVDLAFMRVIPFVASVVAVFPR